VFYTFGKKGHFGTELFLGERESDIFLIFYTNKYSLIFVTVVVGMVIYFFYMVESCFETCLLLVHMYILNYITRNIYQPNIPTTTTTTKNENHS